MVIRQLGSGPNSPLHGVDITDAENVTSAIISAEKYFPFKLWESNLDPNGAGVMGDV